MINQKLRYENVSILVRTQKYKMMWQSLWHHDFPPDKCSKSYIHLKGNYWVLRIRKIIDWKLRYENMSILVRTPKYKKGVTVIVTSWFSAWKVLKMIDKAKKQLLSTSNQEKSSTRSWDMTICLFLVRNPEIQKRCDSHCDIMIFHVTHLKNIKFYHKKSTVPSKKWKLDTQKVFCE